MSDAKLEAIVLRMHAALEAIARFSPELAEAHLRALELFADALEQKEGTVRT